MKTLSPQTGRDAAADMKIADVAASLPGFVYRCENTRDWPVSVLTENFASITGYATEEFLEHRRNYGDIIYEADAARVWNEVQAALADKRHYQLEYRLVRKDGEVIWVSEHGNGVWDAEGKLACLVGYVSDVTDLVVKEKELRAKNEELERIVKSLVERETRMVELKNEVARLRARYEKK